MLLPLLYTAFLTICYAGNENVTLPLTGRITGGGDLPTWAIGPFTRSQSNPILKPQGTGFESTQTLNPGVVRVNGTYHMLYRRVPSHLPPAIPPDRVSEIGMATSRDGIDFARSDQNPVIFPTLPNEVLGTEDPRLFHLNGTYYTFYSGTSAGTDAVDINETTSTDLVHWTKLGPVVHGTKNGAVVTDPEGTPVLLNGLYRMYVGEIEAFFIWTSPDMVRWTLLGPIVLGYGQEGEPDEVCVAITNYPRRDGTVGTDILLFTAGRLFPLATWAYAISEQLWSRDDALTRIDSLPYPIFVPTTEYELVGLTPATVFMNSILFNGVEWMMHYGAADTVVGLATAQP